MSRVPRRWWLAAVASIVVLAAIAIPSLAGVTGSNFEIEGTNSAFSGKLDANLRVDTSGNQDWCDDFTGSATTCTTKAPQFVSGIDKPTGQTDDSFGQGTSEDDQTPTAVFGSVPNNKSDLDRFYAS